MTVLKNRNGPSGSGCYFLFKEELNDKKVFNYVFEEMKCKTIYDFGKPMDDVGSQYVTDTQEDIENPNKNDGSIVIDFDSL
jgi:hypothetical protein